LSCAAVVALVISDFKSWRTGRYIYKPLAAAAFIWLAILLGATEYTYGKWLLAGLIACALGDLLLMMEDEKWFLAGLGAFLGGHLLYAVAFLQLPHNFTGLALSAIPALVLMLIVMRWLLPHVDSQMKVPVIVYILVITGMLLCSGLTWGNSAAVCIIVGAWCFALSDLAVARQQFIAQNRLTPMWGTPLYFFAQKVLATSLAFR